MAEAPKLRRYVRKAGEKDLIDLMRIWEAIAGYHEQLDTSYFRRNGVKDQVKHFFISAMSRQDARILLLIDGDEIVGYIVGEIKSQSPVFRNGQKGLISEVGILGGTDRIPLARQMVNDLLAWFESKGMHRVEVNADIRNSQSINLWHEMGFEDHSIQLAKDI